MNLIEQFFGELFLFYAVELFKGECDEEAVLVSLSNVLIVIENYSIDLAGGLACGDEQGGDQSEHEDESQSDKFVLADGVDKCGCGLRVRYGVCLQNGFLWVVGVRYHAARRGLLCMMDSCDPLAIQVSCAESDTIILRHLSIFAFVRIIFIPVYQLFVDNCIGFHETNHDTLNLLSQGSIRNFNI